ncbi:30113_t:CDS:1, partial [Racocetra persica]
PQEITKDTIDLLDYYLEELTEIEQYICFDENITASKDNENEEVLTDQININFEECDNSMQVNVSNEIVVASEDIPKDTAFDSWTEIEVFFEEYGRQNGFIVIKYCIRKDKGGLIHKQTFICEFGEKYSPNKSKTAAQKSKPKNTKSKK